MIVTLLAAALGAAAFIAPASAVNPAGSEPFSIGVFVGDLDLASAEGQRSLARRMRAQADRTCAPRPWPAHYEPRSFSACRAAFRIATERHIAQAARQ